MAERTLKNRIRSQAPALFAGLKTINQTRLTIIQKLRVPAANVEKRRIAGLRAGNHEKLVRHARSKAVLRVLFIGLHRSVWKTDEVFRAMQADPMFDPAVLIVPTLNRDQSWADAEQQQALMFFKAKGYTSTCVLQGDGPESAIRKVEQLAPDIVFFTNHHTLTFPELYEYLLQRYLTVYVPYSASVSRFNNYQTQYNQSFHNEVWRIFSPHTVAAANYRAVQAIRGRNVRTTGYPAFEPLVVNRDITSDPWRPLGLKRLIWAPHHTIDMPNLPYANFLRYADYFRELVESHADQVQWTFKPHPLLKPKLIRHPDWGPKRTDEYYRFWESHPVTQLELGEYVGLFRNSDAMIHDSGSFLAEYLYVDKPVLYLWSSPEVVRYFNEFGLDALGACERGDSQADIRRFIDAVLVEDDECRGRRHAFLSKHPVSIDDELPSNRILKEIKSAIWPS
jgi:hypothetical protein